MTRAKAEAECRAGEVPYPMPTASEVFAAINRWERGRAKAKAARQARKKARR